MKIVITGGQSGIGLSMANYFSRLGHEVHVTSRNPLVIPGIVSHQLDLNKSESIDQFIQNLNFEHIDMLINNAGNGILGPLTELSRQQTREQFESNLFGPMELVSKILPKLKNGGHLVNISSISPEIGLPFGGIYTASKAAMNTVSDIWRIELAHLQIKVTTIRPGLLSTNFAKKSPYPLIMSDKSSFQKFKKSIEERANLSTTGTDPDLFAKNVCPILLKKNCPAIIYSGKGSCLYPIILRFIPTNLKFKIILKKFNLI